MSRGHSRRALLGRSAAALLLAAPAAGEAKAAGLDGELIRLCEQYVATDQECRRVSALSADWHSSQPSYQENRRQVRALMDRQGDLFDRIAACRPRTPEGLRAMAVAALHSLAVDMGDADPEPVQYEMNLAWVVCGVVAERAGTARVGAPPAPVQAASPDAELIAACDEWLRIRAAFDRHVDSLPGDVPDDDPAWSILDEKNALEKQIIAACAVTAEGQLARLRCAVAHWVPDAWVFRDDPDAAFEDRLRRATLRDTKALGRA